MHHTAALGTAQQQRKLSPVAAGLGAAVIAMGITLAMTMSNGTSAQEEQAAAPAKQCQLMSRKLLISTTTGGGTVRLRGGGYLSPPITLSSTPQSVVFPLSRPDVTPVEEVITIEGNASDVVITSAVTNFRRVYDVRGVTAFNVIWKPVKNC